MDDNKLYCFTEDQLWKFLRGAIDLYEENRQRGQKPDLAKLDAITGSVDGLDAETELLNNGERITPTFRLMEAVNV